MFISHRPYSSFLSSAQRATKATLMRLVVVAAYHSLTSMKFKFKSQPEPEYKADSEE